MIQSGSGVASVSKSSVDSTIKEWDRVNEIVGKLMGTSSVAWALQFLPFPALLGPSSILKRQAGAASHLSLLVGHFLVALLAGSGRR